MIIKIIVLKKRNSLKEETFANRAKKRESFFQWNLIPLKNNTPKLPTCKIYRQVILTSFVAVCILSTSCFVACFPWIAVCSALSTIMLVWYSKAPAFSSNSCSRFGVSIFKIARYQLVERRNRHFTSMKPTLSNTRFFELLLFRNFSQSLRLLSLSQEFPHVY